MKKAGWKCGLAALVGAACMAVGAVVPSAETVEPYAVSYGLQVLSAATDMAISAPVGNEIVFSAEDFARALNLSKINYVTVKTLPDVTAGELLLGSTRVAAGQTISAAILIILTRLWTWGRFRQLVPWLFQI